VGLDTPIGYSRSLFHAPFDRVASLQTERKRRKGKGKGKGKTEKKALFVWHLAALKAVGRLDSG
jgi:hypothetical protein